MKGQYTSAGPCAADTPVRPAGAQLCGKLNDAGASYRCSLPSESLTLVSVIPSGAVFQAEREPALSKRGASKGILRGAPALRREPQPRHGPCGADTPVRQQLHRKLPGAARYTLILRWENHVSCPQTGPRLGQGLLRHPAQFGQCAFRLFQPVILRPRSRPHSGRLPTKDLCIWADQANP